MLSEEWDHHVQEVATTMDCVQVHVLAVVVVSRVHVHATNAEELTKCMQYVGASRALHHDEIVIDLIAGSVAFSALSVRLSDEADGEAPFSVYETSNPLRVDRSFLLIVWRFHCGKTTSRIFSRSHTRNIGVRLREPEDSSRCSSIWSDFSKAAIAP